MAAISTFPTPEPEAETVDVTPEMAATWLALNTHNRHLRRRVVEQYAADMKAGAWRFTGDAIKFARDGTLLDGQHRLAAVVLAGVTVRFLVVRGLEAEVQEHTDQGVRRNLADVLSLRGEANATALAAVLRMAHQWETRPGTAIGTGTASAMPQSVSVLLGLLAAHPEFRDIAREAHRLGGLTDLTGAQTGLLLWVFGRLPNAEEDVPHFFARLADGQRLEEGDPIYELRKALRKLRDARGSTPTALILALTIKAWNAYRDGSTIRVLYWRSGGANREQFPEPR